MTILVQFLASNPVVHARMKHLEVGYHYIRPKVIHKELYVRNISTSDQVADVFRKGLASARLKLLSNKPTVRSTPICFRGCDSKTKSAHVQNHQKNSTSLGYAIDGLLYDCQAVVIDS